LGTGILEAFPNDQGVNLMKIICKKCSAAKGREVEKEPCLYQPRDVKAATVREDGRLVSVCRNCRKETREKYTLRAANPGNWRVSMKAIFVRDYKERAFGGEFAGTGKLFKPESVA